MVIPSLRPIDALMPLLGRHLGIWEGTYSYFDLEGNLLDRHASRLDLRVSGDEWFQTNQYFWEDGRELEKSFPAKIYSGCLVYDTDEFKGIARDIGDDRTLVLTFSYLNEPETWLNEIITLVSSGARARTWQYFHHGRFVKLCAITETKVG